MIFDPSYPIFLYHDYIDMRKGHNTLSHVVTHKMDMELMSGALFLFVAKNRKATKAIFFDGNGLVIVHKKLERGRFMSFDNLSGTTEINSNELSLILNGGQIPLSKAGKKILLRK
jgi:transposase